MDSTWTIENGWTCNGELSTEQNHQSIRFELRIIWVTVVDTKFEPPDKKNEPPDKKNDPPTKKMTPRQKKWPPRKMVDWIKNLLEKTNEFIFYKCLTKKIIFLLYL